MVHLAAEQGRKALSLRVTAGQRGDSPQFQPALEDISVPRLGPVRPRCPPDEVRADKAHASRANRAYLRRRGIKACIPAEEGPAGPLPGQGPPRRAALSF